MKTFSAITNFVTVVTVVLNLFVYFYPDIVNRDGQCDWHRFDDDTPLPKAKYPWIDQLPPAVKSKLLSNFASLRQDDGSSEDIHILTFGDPQINGNWPLTPYIKRLDNYGNDYYLGHIYSIMKLRLRPLHVAVMGDQFSLQWIYDLEFYNRTYRFVERLFPRNPEYKQTVLDFWQRQENFDWMEWMRQEQALDPNHRFSLRNYADVYDWVSLDRNTPNYDQPLFINLTGNHDIGYLGDATWQHMARFHQLFGQNNYVITYDAGTEKEWRIIVLDSLTLEGPALEEDFRNYTWSFLNHIKADLNPNFKGPTILFTHIPFYKRAGLCADGPEHKFYIDYAKEPYKNGKLRLQNHLWHNTTQTVMDIVFPNPDQNGMILTGHDHVGCDDWYNYINGEWVALKERQEPQRKLVREIVVRAMMGDFDGQTGVFTGHFDKADHKWKFEFTYCLFVVQHWWWALKVLALVTLLLQLIKFLI